MKRRSLQIFGSCVFLLLTGYFVWAPSSVYSQPNSNQGIQPLLELGGQDIHSLIPKNVHSLLLPQEIVQYLEKLEDTPPDWTKLRHHDIAEQSERLFQINRARDEARLAKDSLRQQPVAFVWGGLLRQYLPKFNGFSLALGPELIQTSWGIIRFKPIDLPDYLVAIPSVDLRKQLMARQKDGELIDIIVLCIGTLIADESLIYGFSHDGDQRGMILPVVSVQKIMYLFKR